MSFLIAVKNGVGNTMYCYTLQRQTNSEQTQDRKSGIRQQQLTKLNFEDWINSTAYLYYNNLIN